MTQTLRELMAAECDIDVNQDVLVREPVALVGPIVLTDKGKTEFADILDLPVDVDTHYNYAEVHCHDSVITAKHVIKFLLCAAGYCNNDYYEEIFEEVED